MSENLTVAEPQRTLWCEATSAAALERVAGDKVLVRGQAHAAGDAVQDLSWALDDGGLRAEATVAGTQDYQVWLSLSAEAELDAGCGCPHAQDGYFCKHQVALVLAVHALLGGGAVVHDAAARKKVEAAAKRTRTQAAKREALRRFLGEQSVETLAERLWIWADRDRDLMAELKSWVAMSRTGSDTGALKSAITQVLAAPGFLGDYESNAYAQRARAVLQLLQGALNRDAVQARALCEHALRRLFKAGEQADDSDGAIGDVMHEVMAVLKQAVAQAHPPATWVRDWFDLLDADPWGLWPAELLLDVAGPDFAQAYGRKVTDDWLACVARHPAQAQPARRTGAWDYERSRLRRRYIEYLKRTTDAGTVIEAMRAHVTEAHECVELVEYCESAGRFREAMQAAQDGARRFADDWRVQACLLRCYERDGWDEEALALRRKALERSPGDLKAYDALLAAAERAGRPREAYRAELYAWAEQPERSDRLVRQPASQRPGGGQGSDVSLRVTWLLHERRELEALALVQPPNRCHVERLWELALRLPADQYDQAVTLLLRVFDAIMLQSSSPYTRELELARDLAQRQLPEARRAWLADLRMRYKAKRNFIQGLPE